MNKDIKHSSSNINEINDENDDDKNIMLEIKLDIIFEFILKEFGLNMTLLDLKNYINTNFHLNENEYALYIDKKNISNLPQETLISNIINKNNTNNINIKTFKTIFDVNKELDEYEKFLTNNISLKNDDINMLIKEYNDIKEELNNITK